MKRLEKISESPTSSNILAYKTPVNRLSHCGISTCISSELSAALLKFPNAPSVWNGAQVPTMWGSGKDAAASQKGMEGGPVL